MKNKQASRKRLCLAGMLLAVLMAVFLLPGSVQAEETDAVAQIGETTYATFKEALAAANAATEAQTITLLSDVEDTSTTYSNNGSSADITIDLNGHTLAMKELQTQSASKLTVKDSQDKKGVLKTNFKSYKYGVENAFSLENVSMEGYIYLTYSSALTINDSKITSASGNVIWSKNRGATNSISITDSEITAQEGMALLSADDENTEIIVTDSTLSGKLFAGYSNDTITVEGDSKFGGSCGALLGETELPTGTKISQTQTDGYYTLIASGTEEDLPVIAKIGSTEYTDVAEALSAAGKGETVALTANAVMFNGAKIEKSDVTLDLAGYELTVYPSLQTYDDNSSNKVDHTKGNSLYVAEKASLSIIDSSEGKTGLLSAGILNDYDIPYVAAGELNVTDVTVKGISYTGSYSSNAFVSNNNTSMFILNQTAGAMVFDTVRTSEDNKINIIKTTDSDQAQGTIAIKNTEFALHSTGSFINGTGTAVKYTIDNCTVTDDTRRTTFLANTQIKDTTWKMTNASCAGLTFYSYSSEDMNVSTIENCRLTSEGSAAILAKNYCDLKLTGNVIKAKNGYAVNINSTDLTSSYTVESGKYIGRDYSIRVTTAVNINGGSFGGKVYGTANCPEGKALVLQENGYYELDDSDKAEAEEYVIGFYDQEGNEIGGASEGSLTFACQDLADGTVMKLLSDITLTSSMYIQRSEEGGSLTLDLNGHTLEVGFGYALAITNNTELTIVDSTDEGSLIMNPSGLQSSSGTTLNLNSGNYVLKYFIRSFAGNINLNGGHYDLTVTNWVTSILSLCPNAKISGGDYNIDVSTSEDSDYIDSNCKVTETDGRYYVEGKYTFGSAKTNLAPGYYTLPLSMKKTNKIDGSMASGCIGDATLVVCQDGTAYIDMTLGKVDCAGITGGADQWAVYQENAYGTGVTAAYAKVVDTATINEGPYALDEETTGMKDYDRPSEIAYAIPDTSTDGSYVNMRIPVMGCWQDAYFLYDYTKAVLQEETADIPSTVPEDYLPAEDDLAAGTATPYLTLKVNDEETTEYTMVVGDTLDVTAVMVQGLHTYTLDEDSYTWTMSTAKATVEGSGASGKITAVTKGKATLTVTVNYANPFIGELPYIPESNQVLTLTSTVKITVKAAAAADFTAVDAALAKVPDDLSNYTDESVKTLNTAINSVDRDATVNDQTLVDGWATALEEAIAGLELKEADYTAVDAALAKIPEDLTLYTDATAQAVTTAQDAVVRGKTIDAQEEVDDMAAAIEEAVAGLIKKDFGSSKVNLAAGTYKLNVSMMDASDITKASAAASCIKGGELVVDENGKATVTIDLQEGTVNDAASWTSNWRLYDGDIADGSLSKMSFTEDEEDHVISISFAVSANDLDGVYVRTYVESEKSGLDAYLAFNYSTASKKYDFGSAATKLAAGTYDIPVTLLNAGNHEKSSMANSAVKSATLTVAQDGSAALTLQLQAVTSGAITDWAYNWKYYTSENYTEATPVDAEEHKTPEGKVDEATFKIADTAADGFYINMYVDAMSTTADAYVSLDYTKASQAADTTLADGIYVIDGKMVKPDKETASMSDKAITHKIKLEVKDGVYYVTLNFKGLDISGQTGYLGSLSYYKTGYTQSGTVLSGETAEVTVNSVQKYTDGTVVEDTLGTDYPDYVTFALIDEAIRYGYAPLQVYVPIMESMSEGSGTQDVLLSLDWDSVKETTADDEDFDSEDVITPVPVVDLSDCTFSSVGSQTYTGSAIKPAVTVKNGTKTLTKGTDYTLSYSNNTKVGTATVTVTGKGNYTGTKKITFKITAADISKATFGSVSAKNYTGKAIKPSVTVKYKSKTLVSGTDYKLTYSNNTKMGTATITVTGKGNFKSTKKITFKIIAVKGKTYTSGTNKYKVLNASTTAGTVAYAGTTSKTATSLTIPSTVKLGAVTYKVTQVANKALKGNTKLKTVTIGANVTYVGSDSFRSCTALTKIVVGKNVKKIGERAFYGDSKLKTITVKSTKLTTVGAKALYGIYKKAVITVPSSKLAAYKKLFKGKGQASTVTITK